MFKIMIKGGVIMSKVIRPDDPGGMTLKLVVLLAGIVVLILGSFVLDISEKDVLESN